jgi:hypothetical protein
MNTYRRFCTCHRRASRGVLSITTGAPPTGGGSAPLRDRTLPDTPAARAAEGYLDSVSSLTMVRHCKRTFRFGLALADKAGARLDLEAFYVGCLFHDLGLEEQFAGPEDFEVLGAREAGRFLNAHGYAYLAEQAAAAIAIHTTPETAGDPRPEVAYLAMGAMVDVVGARLDQIEPRLIQQIVAEYPRDGTKAMLIAMIKGQIDSKPGSNIAGLHARLGVLQRMADAPFTD